MLDLLFVYGTLRRQARSRMQDLMGQQAEFVAAGTYQGQLYLVDYYPGAVPSPDPRHQVAGDVFRLAGLPQTLALLDAYEECGEGAEGVTEYIREVARIRLADGRMTDAWIYRYNYPVEELPLIPSGDFLTLPGTRLE